MSIKALRTYPTFDAKNSFTWNVSLTLTATEDVVAALMGDVDAGWQEVEEALAVAKCKEIVHDLDNTCLCKTCCDWWDIRRRYL